MSARYGEILARNRSHLDLGTASTPMGSAEKHGSIKMVRAVLKGSAATARQDDIFVKPVCSFSDDQVSRKVGMKAIIILSLITNGPICLDSNRNEPETTRALKKLELEFSLSRLVFKFRLKVD